MCNDMAKTQGRYINVSKPITKRLRDSTYMRYLKQSYRLEQKVERWWPAAGAGENTELLFSGYSFINIR